MPVARNVLHRLLYGEDAQRRFTQDSPVLPDVWLAYAAPATADGVDERRAAENGIDLLLRPHAQSNAADLAAELARRLERPRSQTRLAHNQAYVAVQLRFDEMVRAALPLTPWWRALFQDAEPSAVLKSHRQEILRRLRDDERQQGKRLVADDDELAGNVVWFVAVAGTVARAVAASRDVTFDASKSLKAAIALVEGAVPHDNHELLWAVTRNRTITTSLWRSRLAVKADAAEQLFSLSCRNLVWAVIDSGIDATHPAFRSRDDAQVAPGAANSRIVRTYEFYRLRDVLTPPPDTGSATLASETDSTELKTERWVTAGRAVDWDELEPKLRLEHESDYRPPQSEHGTHVAGIIGADWQQDDDPGPGEHDIRGICPDIYLYDLRVFDDNGDGDEFSILSALQFIRHLNAHSDIPVIHGVNLSLSIKHDLANYACGRTPVCDEAERVVAAGIVVVAAAGNDGLARYETETGSVDGYRNISITDPGNAEEVITVGATHRDEPHTYGVSYFSSRGPTGDGRRKPDLVAPGEKITAPIPGGGLKTLDGTSMAAPHVSGVAALLLARHPELLGRPSEVKRTLCDAATDLGRERYFQGHGMVDALRAIQAV